jgi:hypothetical protein
MSKKTKIEKDYKDYNLTIEKKAQEEIKKIKIKVEHVMKEAKKVGETLESENQEGGSTKQEKS